MVPYTGPYIYIYIYRWPTCTSTIYRSLYGYAARLVEFADGVFSAVQYHGYRMWNAAKTRCTVLAAWKGIPDAWCNTTIRGQVRRKPYRVKGFEEL